MIFTKLTLFGYCIILGIYFLICWRQLHSIDEEVGGLVTSTLYFFNIVLLFLIAIIGLLLLGGIIFDSFF